MVRMVSLLILVQLLRAVVIETKFLNPVPPLKRLFRTALSFRALMLNCIGPVLSEMVHPFQRFVSCLHGVELTARVILTFCIFKGCHGRTCFIFQLFLYPYTVFHK